MKLEDIDPNIRRVAAAKQREMEANYLRVRLKRCEKGIVNPVGWDTMWRNFRLCNLSSGNCIERCSRILASPLYICLCVSAPLFIDFDEDGANEPHERVFIREDPHFGCASF